MEACVAISLLFWQSKQFPNVLLFGIIYDVSMETVWQILLYVLMSVLLWLPSNVLYMQTRFDFLRTIVRLTFPIQVPLKVFFFDEMIRGGFEFTDFP